MVFGGKDLRSGQQSCVCERERRETNHDPRKAKGWKSALKVADERIDFFARGFAKRSTAPHLHMAFLGKTILPFYCLLWCCVLVGRRGGRCLASVPKIEGGRERERERERGSPPSLFPSPHPVSQANVKTNLTLLQSPANPDWPHN